MTSADRRRAHARVGAAATGVFLVLLVLGLGQRAAGASAGGSTPAGPAFPVPRVPPTVPPGQLPPSGGHRGFDPDHDGGGEDRGFGRDRGFGGGPPGGGGMPAAPTGGEQT